MYLYELVDTIVIYQTLGTNNGGSSDVTQRPTLYAPMCVPYRWGCMVIIRKILSWSAMEDVFGECVALCR